MRRVPAQNIERPDAQDLDDAERGVDPARPISPRIGNAGGAIGAPNAPAASGAGDVEVVELGTMRVPVMRPLAWKPKPQAAVGRPCPHWRIADHDCSGPGW